MDEKLANPISRFQLARKVGCSCLWRNESPHYYFQRPEDEKTVAINFPSIVFVFPLEVAERFKFFKGKESTRFESTATGQILGEEGCGSSVFPCCPVQYPTVFWFLGTRGWHQLLLWTPCNSGREMRRAGLLPLEQAQGRAGWVCRKVVSRLMVPSLHPICLCAPTWRGWCVQHVGSVSLIIIELISKMLCCTLWL